MPRFVVAALLLTSSIAFAQRGPGISEVMRARAYGMGGAYRSLGGGTEAVDGNPASMGIYRRYIIELGGAWDPRNPFGFGAVSVMDSATSPVAAGLAYHLVTVGSGEEQRTAHINTAAFSLPFANLFHVGVSTRHVLMNGARDANAITGDAGLLLNLGGIVIGASGHNLIDIANPEFPRYFAASLGWVTPVFSVAVDARGDFNDGAKFAFSGGAEFVVGNFLPLRAGYNHDLIRNSRTIGGGIGLLIDTGAIDFSYQHELGGSYSRLLALTLRMQVQ